jgi:tetratricopeptide (TPR) repeat protein
VSNQKIEKIQLDKAIQQIKRICDVTSKSEKKFPYFFIIGAGVSQPHIKLSSDIILECKEINKKNNLGIEDTHESDKIKEYSYWLEQVYPSPELRRQYFEKITKDKPISTAQLRLAHLILKKKVTNIVVTPNFDDQLSRALWLFEKEHISYDHPRTIERIDLNRDSIHVIHVHGNYHFYDIKNLAGEIKDNADNSLMLDKLTAIMSQYSPIVIGYSGWKNDVIMKAMERVIGSTTKNNLYWFCYCEEDIDSLPDFLKNATNVKFVIPNVGKIFQELPSTIPSIITNDFSKLPPETTPQSSMFQESPKFNKESFSNNLIKFPSLTAVQVFDEFNRAFDCGSPELLDNPIEFFINKLKLMDPSLKDPDEYGKTSDVDIYSIGRVIRKMSRAEKYLDEQSEKSERDLNAIITAVRQSNYADALKIAGDLQVSLLEEDEQIGDFVNAMRNALDNQNLSLDDSILLFNKLQLKMNEFDKSFPEIISLKCKIIERLCFVLIKSNRHEDAIAAFDQIISCYNTSDDPKLQEAVCWALWGKGDIIRDLGKPGEAIAILNQAISQYDTIDNIEIQKMMAGILSSKGLSLADLGKDTEAITTYDQIISRYSTSNNPELQERANWALWCKGDTFKDLGKYVEAIATYDQVLTQNNLSSPFTIPVTLIWVLLGKGDALNKIGKPDEAITTYDQAIEIYGKSENPRLQGCLSWIFWSKGKLLERVEKYTEAIKVYDQEISLYSSSDNPLLQEGVIRALMNKGNALNKIGKPDEAITTYDQAIEIYGKSDNPRLQEGIIRVLLNKGFILKGVGDREAALTTFDKIVKSYGKLKQSELKKLVGVARRQKYALKKI